MSEKLYEYLGKCTEKIEKEIENMKVEAFKSFFDSKKLKDVAVLSGNWMLLKYEAIVANDLNE